jgi:hypothetical protein
LEWTWLAFRLVLAGKKIAFLDEPTFRIHDTADSASKSDAYRKSVISLHQRMLASRPRSDIARIIRVRLGSAWHDLATDHMRAGNWSLALNCHVRSLAYPCGWRFLSFTRHFLGV